MFPLLFFLFSILHSPFPVPGALQLKQPGLAYRGLVAVTQYVFGGFFFASYILSPKVGQREPYGFLAIFAQCSEWMLSSV